MEQEKYRYTDVDICVYKRAYVCCICAFVRDSTCLRMCACICIYIHIHVHIHVYVYIHM